MKRTLLAVLITLDSFLRDSTSRTQEFQKGRFYFSLPRSGSIPGAAGLTFGVNGELP